jgi:growth arrest-specific protein 8
MEKERLERAEHELERNRVVKFWDITKEELGNREAELRNKERELEELEERHQRELKVYKQKVKHMLYEHHNNVAILKRDDEQYASHLEENAREAESQQRRDTRKVKSEMRELDMAHEDMVKNLKQEHDKQMTRMRQEHEAVARALQQKHDTAMAQLRTDLELRRKNEVHALEERKNAHIDTLIKKHDTAFAEMKAYYNDVTANNLEVIKTLKGKIETMKVKEVSDQKLMLEVTAENKRLSEPLTRAREENESLKKELGSYEKDKQRLKHSKARVRVLESELKPLQWEHEVLEEKFGAVQGERDDLYEKFVGAIHEVQQQSGLRNVILERKMVALGDDLETREIQLSSVIASAAEGQNGEIDPETAHAAAIQAEETLKQKNDVIDSLQYELKRARRAHNDTVAVYTAKLAEYGVPPEELGFEPNREGESDDEDDDGNHLPHLPSSRPSSGAIPARLVARTAV